MGLAVPGGYMSTMYWMKRSDKASPLRASVAGGFFALAGLFFFAAHSAAAGDSRSCNESCDRKAADCLDACDAKHKDDKPRVECKLQCAAERQKCESACQAP